MLKNAIALLLWEELRLHYSLFYLVSFIGTKIFGLEGTILKFRSLGLFLRRLFRFRSEPSIISRRLERGMHIVPLNIKCLDQAIVTWFILNLHGHPAILRIGMSITPLESHAWVVLGARIFVDAPIIPDLKVVAEYESW